MGKLGIMNLALITYFLVCAGPYGIEESVRAVGPGIAIITIASIPILLSFPLSMIYSEMGSLYPQRGSTVMWGQSLRSNVGLLSRSKLQKKVVDIFTHIYTNTLFIKAVCQNATLPSLIAGYMKNLWQPFEETLWRFLIALISFIIVFVLNLYGIDAVGVSQYVFTAIIMLPIILLICFSFPKWDMEKLAFSNSPNDKDFGFLISNIVWSSTGFDLSTNLSGEVTRPRKTYPLAMTLTIVLIIISLSLPIAAGSMIQPDWQVWDNAAFAEISLQIPYCANGWLKYWLIGAGAISSLSVLNALLACTSREIYCTALSGLMPFGSYIAKLISVKKKTNNQRKDKTQHIDTTEQKERGVDESTIISATDIITKMGHLPGIQFGDQEQSELLAYQTQQQKEIQAKNEPKGAVPLVGMIYASIIPILLQILPFDDLLAITSFCIATSMMCQMFLFVYAKYGKFGYYQTKTHVHGFSLPKIKVLLVIMIIPPVLCICLLYVTQGLQPFILWGGAQVVLLLLWITETCYKKQKIAKVEKMQKMKYISAGEQEDSMLQ